MGRHRSDPRGLARILLVALAVLVALGLLILGAVSLWGAMSAQPQSAPPLGTLVESPAVDKTVATPRRPTSASRSSRQARRVPTLVLIASGGDVKVSARVPGGKVLFRGVLRQDQERRFNNPRIDLVVQDTNALQVIINGKKQPPGAPGERRAFRIAKASAAR